MAVVIQIDGYDPVGGLPVTLRAGSVDDPRVCHLNSILWWPALASLPTLRYDLFDGSFAAQITAPTSTLALQTEQWPDFGRYALANARLQLWTGEPGAAWAAWTLRFDGRITAQPKVAAGVASIDFAVDDSWLDAALLTTYAGTTGVEGPAELKGQAKPLALGAPRYVPGKLIDSINTVFQLSAYGAIGGIEAALEKLARFSAPVGDRPSYASLVATDIPAGRWATCRASGLVRFGAPTEGLISFLVQGDIAGTEGWARKPGQLIRRLAILSGGAGKIDDASLDALDAVRPYNLSLYVEEQTTARDLIQRIAASVNAVAGVSWTGKLFVVPIGLAPASLTLSADGSTLPPVRSIEQIAVEAPWQKLAIGAARAWTVHALSDIAFTAPLVDLGTYDNATTYREGNIVTLPNGSRWLYINTTAAAGNAPAAGAFWSLLVPPITAGDITFASGETLEDLKPAGPGATAGAPVGTNIGGRPVVQFLSDMDLNGRNWFDLASLTATRDALMLARVTLNGMPIGTVVTNLTTQVTDQNSATAESLSYLGAKVGDATAEIVEIKTAAASTNAANAQAFEALNASVGDVNASISSLRSIVIDPDGNVTAKAVFALNVDANGKKTVAGIVATNDGTVSSIDFMFSSYNLLNPAGASIFFYADPTSGGDGRVYMRGVVVDTLDANTVRAENIVSSSVQQTNYVVTPSDVNIARGATATVAQVAFDKDEDASVLEMTFFGKFWSVDDLQFSVAFVVNNSVSYDGGSINIVLDNQSSQGRATLTPFYILEGMPKGRITVAVTVYNGETDNVVLTAKAGSYLKVVELKQGAL